MEHSAPPKKSRLEMIALIVDCAVGGRDQGELHVEISIFGSFCRVRCIKLFDLIPFRVMLMLFEIRRPRQGGQSSVVRRGSTRAATRTNDRAYHHETTEERLKIAPGAFFSVKRAFGSILPPSLNVRKKNEAGNSGTYSALFAAATTEATSLIPFFWHALRSHFLAFSASCTHCKAFACT